MNYSLILVIILSVFVTWGMVVGDNINVVIGKIISQFQCAEYSGKGPTKVTPARLRPRTLKNFDDARIRQDQYNRKDEPMKSRK